MCHRGFLRELDKLGSRAGKVEECLLVIVEAAGVASDTLSFGIESVELEETVVGSTPSPVEMEETVTLIAVADESVAGLSVISGIVDGADGPEVGVNQVFPFLGGIIVAAD